MKNPEKYTRLFLDGAAGYVNRMEACLASSLSGEAGDLSDCREARLAAHSLKGDALMMGFAEIAEAAASLEKMLLSEMASEGSMDLVTFRTLLLHLEQLISSKQEQAGQAPG